MGQVKGSPGLSPNPDFSKSPDGFNTYRSQAYFLASLSSLPPQTAPAFPTMANVFGHTLPPNS